LLLQASNTLPLFQLPAIIRVMPKSLLRSLRPRQWSKNIVVFAALVFDGQLFLQTPLLRTLAGFVLLCLISSTVYLYNDIADIEADQQHPVKRNRPIASGKISKQFALAFATLLGALSLYLSFQLGQNFGLIVLLYFVLNLFYSLRLKHTPIIDVLLIAVGFVLRVAAGVSLITVERFSPWLYLCMTLAALIIGFGKRRAELSLLAGSANTHRKVLDGYTIPFLDHLIVIASSSTIMAYSLYSFFAENLPENKAMMLTIPFVMYGVFRYLHLIHVEGAGGAPEEIFLSDRPLQITVALWGILSVFILYPVK
jgi:4-hydroxybenzoate polyprenyltransferase